MKTPKVLHNEKEVTDQEVADVDAAEEDDVMVTESLIENLVIQRAHTRYLHSFKAFEMRYSILSILLPISIFIRDLINVKVLVLETGVLLKMI